MTHQVFLQLAVSAGLVVVCVMVHGVGLFSLSRAMRSEVSAERLQHMAPLSLRGGLFTLGAVIVMLSLHGIEILIYTLAYQAIGAIPEFEPALYFSTISYSTVGYNDVHIAEAWRLVGAIESVLGMFLLGWSTAFFFRMIGRIDPH